MILCGKVSAFLGNLQLPPTNHGYFSSISEGSGASPGFLPRCLLAYHLWLISAHSDLSDPRELAMANRGQIWGGVEMEAKMAPSFLVLLQWERGLKEEHACFHGDSRTGCGMLGQVTLSVHQPWSSFL